MCFTIHNFLIMSNTQPVTSATEAITYGLQDAYNVYKKTSLQML